MWLKESRINHLMLRREEKTKITKLLSGRARIKLSLIRHYLCLQHRLSKYFFHSSLFCWIRQSQVKSYYKLCCICCNWGEEYSTYFSFHTKPHLSPFSSDVQGTSTEQTLASSKSVLESLYLRPVHINFFYGHINNGHSNDYIRMN